MAASKRRASSSHKRRKRQTRLRAILFLIVVLALLGFLGRYLSEYGGGGPILPQESSRSEEPSQSEEPSKSEESSVSADSSAEEEESSAEESLPEEASEEESSDVPEEESSEPELEVSTSGESSRADYVVVDPNEGDWRLVLVNKTHRLASNMEIETRQIQGEEVDARIYDSLVQMLEDGERDSDREFLVCSGYRSVDLQEELFENKIQRVMASDASLTYDEAYEIAATVVAIPGASEHNTGLTVDICAVDFQMLIEEYEETDEAQWLRENCYRYGFILRYPKGKEDVTGIIYEPWHFRYVGVEAATEIMQQGITLEEYLGEVE